MQSVEVSLARELVWPNKCAYCNEPAQALAETKHSTISGFNPFFYTRKFLTIKFPVCHRHRRLARFHGFLSHQSFVDLFVGFLFIPFLLALPLLALPLGGMVTNVLVGLLYAAYPVTVILLKSRMPIKVMKYDEHRMVVGISDAAFASAFKSANG